MKKIFLVLILFIGFNMASLAQAPKAAVKQTVTSTKTAPVVRQNATPSKQTTQATSQTVKATKTPEKDVPNASVVLKKDGTPDKRYKESKTLKKDGSPDMRYKKNK